MLSGKLFIGGQWVAGKQTMYSINPSTEEPIGKVYSAGKKEVAQAIDAAREALQSWRNTPVEQRCEYMRKAADILLSLYDTKGGKTYLKNLIMTEVGKPLVEAEYEIKGTAHMLRFFANAAPAFLKDEIIELDKKLLNVKKSMVINEPVGVVAAIKPWNYPLELPLWSIGSALVAGNTVIFKPSEESPFIGLEIGKIFEKTGLPHGVLNIVTGGPQTARWLLKNDGIDMVSFTGSVSTGRRVAIECARKLCKVSLELGGKDAAIITEDADLELTANGLVWGSFCNSGQVCVSIERIYVLKTRYKKLLSKIIEKTEALRPDIDYGPLINEKQLYKVENHIADAISKGAKILTGGSRPKSKTKGFYYLPTVITDVNNSMQILTEETFGPVLPFIAVDSIEEAVKLANDSSYGLGASIWTGDLHKGEVLARSLDTGMVWINDINLAFPQCPWVGRKNSGTGISLSRWGILEYTNRKHISIELGKEPRRDWWYPY